MREKVQRAYTLRLTSQECNLEIAQRSLWKTHEAVNKGVRGFGDWLLTLRGGFAPAWGEEPLQTRKGGRIPTPGERQNRRILLALSWLTVEPDGDAPAKYVL